MSSRRQKATNDSLTCSGFACRIPYPTTSGFSNDRGLKRFQDYKHKNQLARSDSEEMIEKTKMRQELSKDGCKPLTTTGVKLTAELRRESKQPVNLTGRDGRVIMQRTSFKSQQVPRGCEEPATLSNSSEEVPDPGKNRVDVTEKAVLSQFDLQLSGGADKHGRQSHDFILNPVVKQDHSAARIMNSKRRSRQESRQHAYKTERIEVGQRKLEIQGARVQRTFITGSRVLNCVLSRKATASSTDEDYQDVDVKQLEQYYSSKSPFPDMTRVIEIVARENVDEELENPVLPPVLASKCSIQDRYLAGLVFNPKTPLLREYARISQAKFYDFSGAD